MTVDLALSALAPRRSSIGIFKFVYGLFDWPCARLTRCHTIFLDESHRLSCVWLCMLRGALPSQHCPSGLSCMRFVGRGNLRTPLAAEDGGQHRRRWKRAPRTHPTVFRKHRQPCRVRVLSEGSVVPGQTQQPVVYCYVPERIPSEGVDSGVAMGSST